jgi:hypothetical protein
LALVLLAAGVVTACSDDSTGPAAEQLSLAEASLLAFQVDGMSAGVVYDEVNASEASSQVSGFSASFPPGSGDGTTELEFTRTRECPLGGEVVIEGSLLRTRDAETGHLTVDVSATRTATDCTYGVDGHSITVNGSMSITAHREREMGMPVGLQTMSHVGSFTWERSGGETGSCSVDFTATLDPEAGTRTIQGTFCNRTIDKTWEWDPAGPRGGHGPH